MTMNIITIIQTTHIIPSMIRTKNTNIYMTPIDI